MSPPMIHLKIYTHVASSHYVQFELIPKPRLRSGCLVAIFCRPLCYAVAKIVCSICVRRLGGRQRKGGPRIATNPQAKNLKYQGFDSMKFLILRDGIPRSTGNVIHQRSGPRGS